MYHNIEKHPFGASRYIGYGGGTVWRIYKAGERLGWRTYDRDGQRLGLRGRTLRDISAALEALDAKAKAVAP